MKYILFILLIFLGSSQLIFSQDSLVLINQNFIVGEIKDMDRGVVTIETDYSKDDFRIEWKGIKEIYTTTNFMITLSDGERYSGKIKSDTTGVLQIITDDEGTFQTELDKVVFLKSLNKGFWDQLYASISFGYSLANSNNLRQLSLRSTVGYLAERWMTEATFNTLRSFQSETDPIRTTDASLNYTYYLPKDWYLPATLSFYSSTEQKINLRTLGKLGVGKYLIHTNQSYWGFTVGADYNLEDYSDDTGDRKSWEAFFGSELNLYDIGDFSLQTKAVAYPSLTESGRWRATYAIDAKYDLPLDFYVNVGFSVNFDNQPVEGAPKSDYLFQTTFGWSW